MVLPPLLTAHAGVVMGKSPRGIIFVILQQQVFSQLIDRQIMVGLVVSIEMPLVAADWLVARRAALEIGNARI